MKKLKVGDKLHRYAFNFKTRTVEHIEMTVEETNWSSVKVSYMLNGKLTSSSFYVEKIDQSVTTRCSMKYVILSKPDIATAKRLVRKRLEERKRELKKSIDAVTENMAVLKTMDEGE